LTQKAKTPTPKTPKYPKHQHPKNQHPKHQIRDFLHRAIVGVHCWPVPIMAKLSSKWLQSAIPIANLSVTKFFIFLYSFLKKILLIFFFAAREDGSTKIDKQWFEQITGVKCKKFRVNKNTNNDDDCEDDD
jgi:hypothetical protein